jgi:hypothetical protein
LPLLQGAIVGDACPLMQGHEDMHAPINNTATGQAAKTVLHIFRKTLAHPGTHTL